MSGPRALGRLVQRFLYKPMARVLISVGFLVGVAPSSAAVLSKLKQGRCFGVFGHKRGNAFNARSLSE